jgi:hypothetical protein
LCRICHATVDADPVQMARVIDQTIGLDLYDELLEVKKARHRPWRERDWVRVRGELLAMLKELV